MNERILLIQTSTVPSGFLNCALTIGSSTNSAENGDLGYVEGEFGNLVPQAVDTLYVSHTITKGDTTVPSLFMCSYGYGDSTKFGSFIYNGVLYDMHETVPQGMIDKLYNEFKAQYGKTVQIYVENLANIRGGGGRNCILRHACNSLWRVAS